VLYNNGLLDGTLGYRTNRLSTPNNGDSTAYLSTYQAAPVPDPNGQFLGSDVEYFNKNYKAGRTQQFSADIQHELPWKMAAELGYVGHIGRHLRSNFDRQNALPLDALKLGADLLNRNINGITAADRAYASSVGFTLPANGDAVYTGFNGNVAQALRAFPQYGFITTFLESQGTDDYHALNARLHRQFANGFMFGASYTWSHHMTDAGEGLAGSSDARDEVLQNPYDRKSLRSIAPNSVPHVFVIDYLWELPFGRNKRYLNQNNALDKVVGGWQISAIHRYQSGLPLVIRNSAGRYTDFENFFGVRGSVRPNIVPGQSLTILPTTNGVSYNVLNPAAFSNPAVFWNGGNVGDPGYAAYYADPSVFFGNASSVLPQARLNGFMSENFSILKRTTITERFTVELRGEMFNLFNRHLYGYPETNLDAGSRFGEVTVLPYSLYAPRQIQLGAKIIF
jgi:hypothetical protein